MKIPFPLLAQFAYDIPITRSIGMKSFEDIHSQNPKKPKIFFQYHSMIENMSN